LGFINKSNGSIGIASVGVTGPIGTISIFRIA
jgi:hypothetical protein